MKQRAIVPIYTLVLSVTEPPPGKPVTVSVIFSKVKPDLITDGTFDIRELVDSIHGMVCHQLDSFSKVKFNAKVNL